MRAPLLAAAGAAVVLVALGLAAASPVLSGPKHAPSVCRGTADFDTAALEQDASGELRIVFQHDCSARRVHIVHVINATSGVTGTRRAFMQGELRRAIMALNLGSASGSDLIQVAIVSVGESSADLSLDFTNDITRIISHRIVSHGSEVGCLECGLDRAHEALRRVRGDASPESRPAEFVMIHDFVLDGGDEEAEDAARRAQSSVDAMRDEDIAFISTSRSLATTGYHVGGSQSATLLFRNIGVNHSRTDLRGLDLELDRADWLLMPSSDRPPAEINDENLGWSFDYPPLSGLTITLGAILDPSAPTELTLRAKLVDVRRHERELEFMHVVEPRSLPATITPLPDAPTATSTAPLPTRTPGPTPTLEGLRPPAPAYLPFSLRDPCGASSRRVDLVLLADSSHSMRSGQHDFLADVSGSAGKLIEAMVHDADSLPPGSRRMAVVSFTDKPRTHVSLTSDWEAVVDAAAELATVSTSPYDTTRIDAGLRAAAGELRAHGRADHQPAIVLATDAAVNVHHFDAILDAAMAAQASGIAVYAVGLGQWHEARLLEGVAGSTGRYYSAGDEAALARAFTGIGRALRCGR